MKSLIPLSIKTLVAALLFGSLSVCQAEFPLFVTDQNTNNVNSVDNLGNVSLFATSGLSGPSSLEFQGPDLIVGNFTSSTVRRFSSTGADLGVFASVGLSNVNGLAFDTSGNLYVSSSGNGTVRRFSPTGNDLGVFVSGLNFPAGIVFDSSGNLFVAEYNTNMIHKFSASGSSLGSFSSGGSNPFRMAFDPVGNLYVSNLGSNTIRQFSATGSDLGDFVTGRHISGITFDSGGTLYALDQTNPTAGTIRRYSPIGVDLGVFASGFNSLTDLRFSVAPEPANESPDCTNAAPSIATIWPPNHKFVSVNVVGVTDPDGDPITITIDAIFQDEPVDSTGDGNFVPDGMGIGTNTAQVRAERLGNGNGRVYHIAYTADDGNGGTCVGLVKVCVPHDQGQGVNCVDGGALYNSTLSE